MPVRSISLLRFLNDRSSFGYNKTSFGWLFVSFLSSLLFPVLFDSVFFRCSYALFGAQLYVCFGSLVYLQHRKSFIFVGRLFRLSFDLSIVQFFFNEMKTSQVIRYVGAGRYIESIVYC